jgi:hypothetical protein
MLLLILVIAVALLIWFSRPQRSGFEHSGPFDERRHTLGYNTVSQGDLFRGEENDECLYGPGYRFCNMNNGAPGVCVSNGVCMPDMTKDYSSGKVPAGDCLVPEHKEGCPRFCTCKGTLTTECLAGCYGYFSPI